MADSGGITGDELEAVNVIAFSREKWEMFSLKRKAHTRRFEVCTAEEFSSLLRTHRTNLSLA